MERLSSSLILSSKSSAIVATIQAIILTLRTLKIGLNNSIIIRALTKNAVHPSDDNE